MFHVDSEAPVSPRSELEEAIRTQLILVGGGAGPLVPPALKTILAAVDKYAKSQESMAQVCLAYDTPNRVEKLIGRRPEPGEAFYFKNKRELREFCEGLRSDLNPELWSTRMKS
jgi:hypothetical protein